MQCLGPADSKAADPERLIVKDRATVRQLAIGIAVGIVTVRFRLALLLPTDHTIAAACRLAGGQAGIGFVPIAVIAGFVPLDETISAHGQRWGASVLRRLRGCFSCRTTRGEEEGNEEQFRDSSTESFSRTTLERSESAQASVSSAEVTFSWGLEPDRALIGLAVTMRFYPLLALSFVLSAGCPAAFDPAEERLAPPPCREDAQCSAEVIGAEWGERVCVLRASGEGSCQPADQAAVDAGKVTDSGPISPRDDGGKPADAASGPTDTGARLPDVGPLPPLEGSFNPRLMVVLLEQVAMTV